MKWTRFVAIVMVLGTMCGVQAASPVLDDTAKNWVMADFGSLKGKTFNVHMDNRGNINNSPTSIKVEKPLDYIQLLASELATKQLTSKEMLIKGFILMAMIQGDVWPVDYVHPAKTSSGDDSTEKLLLNASKIAAYAITYRNGVDGAIGSPEGSDTAYVKDTANLNKQEYVYKGGERYNRQGAITKLFENPENLLQLNALKEAHAILFSAHNSPPSTPKKQDIVADPSIYGKMYQGTKKVGKDSSRKVVLSSWLPSKNDDAMIGALGIGGSSALSPARTR